LRIRFIFIFAIITILFTFYNVSLSQGRRDIDKTSQIYKRDTLGVKTTDTLITGRDTTLLQPVDSTARIKYFVYSPEFSYGMRIYEKKHPFLLEDANLVQSSFKFDSLNNIIIRKQFLQEDIKTPLVVPLDEYLIHLQEKGEKNLTMSIISEKFKGEQVDDLAKIFQKFTDITIPLPFVSETIFGPNTFNLRINGTIDITASYQNVKSDQSTVSYFSSDQNNINFKQEVQVTAKGTVGDKLTIDADWNTQRTFDFENQLKIKYTGYPDEVIQKIEAGNVSLDTRSSLIQSTQALFGVKGEFKLGPLYLSTVISQKKSKQETKEYTGGSSEQAFQINVYDYSENHYFLDTMYKSSFLDVYNSTSNQYSPTTYANRVLSDDYTTFEVWIQAEYTDVDKRAAVCWTQLGEKPVGGYPDTLKKTDIVPGVRFFGSMRKLKPTDYFIDPYAGFISLKVNVSPNYTIGVTYSTQPTPGAPLTRYGISSSEANFTDTLILKMIKCENQSPETPLAWELKMKNIYRLPVSKIVEDGFKIDVNYIKEDNIPSPSIPAGGTDKNLLQVLGLDKYTGKEKRPPPDGIFDFIPGATINLETGDIIFPTLRPFYDNIQDAGADTSLIFKTLYTNRKADAQNSTLATRYIIKGTARGEAGISNTINIGFNVVQGSVQIRYGGQVLENNIDYTVDYSTGIIVIRNQAALMSKDLKITYETNDLFQLASKTYIGARADYKLGEKSNLGFTFVNLKQETLNDKVRIGEEPTNNSIFGLDFTTEAKPNFLTKLLNKLPGYNTKEESVFNFKTEFAYIVPDPNTKKSRIPQDNNEAIAYIDDMEGAKKIISLGTNFASWTISSHPVDSTIGIDRNQKQAKRGMMKWYNIFNDVAVKTVYPLRDVQPGQDRLTPFYVYFDPTVRGVYNYNGRFDTLQSGLSTNWNGIMKYLNTTSNDLLNENITYIMFNMKVENPNSIDLSNAKMIIDLGTISEDAIPNGTMDTEDKNRNGILEEIEDLGLDTLTNQQELDLYRSLNNGTDPPNPLDPAGDDNNWRNPSVISYDLINGTQGNRFFEGGNRPDTEDLNRNNALETYNEYFEYEVKLDTTNNIYITGRGEVGSGWYQYAVPLSQFTRTINNPSLTNIQYIRVYLKGVTQAVRLGMVDFNLVGNQWFKPDKVDTTYNITTVSIEENPQIYESPVPGDILRQTVRNITGVNTKSNEQSLSLEVNSLSGGQMKFAVKDLLSQTLDVFNYKSMKMFVNGDPSFNYTSESVYDVTMIIRFGSDTNNYYEYRAPVHPDVRPGQPWNNLNEVTINFGDLTSIKIARDSVNQFVNVPVPNGPPGSYYRVKGNPTLSSLRQFYLGVEKNQNSVNPTATGSVWFNEIRVLKVNDNNGYAFNVNAGLRIADFGNINVNFSKIDPNFHSVDTRQGTRNTGQNWELSGTFNIHKIINNSLVSLFDEDWKDFINLPVSYRHSENLIKPQYYPGTDIELDKAAEQRYSQILAKTGDEEYARKVANDFKADAQTLGVRDEFSLSGLSFRFPWRNYVFENILNRFSVSFSASIDQFRDVTYRTKKDQAYTGSFNFDTDFELMDKFNLELNKIVNLGDEYNNAKIYLFLPVIPLVPLFSDNFNVTADFNRTRNESSQRLLNFSDPTGRLFRANRGFSFNWKFIENWIIDVVGSYNLRIASDLTPFETYNDSSRTQRPESEVLKQIFFNNAIINFGNDLDYVQTNTINPRFNFPVLNKFFDVNLNYTVTYGWQNPNTTANIGYNVGYSNSITAGGNFKIKEIFNLFESTQNRYSGGYERKNTGFSQAQQKSEIDDGNSLQDILKIFRTLIPDNINLSFTQSNTLGNPGVEGKPGFVNFWILPSTQEKYGPSRLYQMGLSNYPGKRAPNLVLTDINNQNNNLSLSASINPILPSAIRVTLTFKELWGLNNTSSYLTSPAGDLGSPTNRTSNRTKGYTTFLMGDIEKFRYESSTDPNENINNISAAFKKSIVSIPFPNWNITISGLERFPLFEEFATSITLENNFTSEFKESFSLSTNNIEIPSGQTMTQSFNPLIGINITFKELFGGSLTGSIRYNKSKTNELRPTSNLIQTSDVYDWSANLNYAKAGFEVPFFGISLKNDIAFTFTISKNVTNPVDYRFIAGSTQPEKLPGNGSSVLTINPSIQYSISSRVQMQIFYKYMRTEPTLGTVTTVPRTSKEGGLNFRILIQ